MSFARGGSEKREQKKPSRRNDGLGCDAQCKLLIAKIQRQGANLSTKLDRVMLKGVKKSAIDDCEATIEELIGAVHDAEGVFKTWQENLAGEMAPEERQHKRYMFEKMKDLLETEKKTIEQLAERVSDARQLVGKEEVQPDPMETTKLLEAEEEIVDFENNFVQAVADDRAVDMVNIQSQMADVNAIFKDLAGIVQEQGETLDTVEANTTVAAEKSIAANKEVQIAAARAHGSYVYQCLLLVVLCLVGGLGFMYSNKSGAEHLETVQGTIAAASDSLVAALPASEQMQGHLETVQGHLSAVSSQMQGHLETVQGHLETVQGQLAPALETVQGQLAPALETVQGQLAPALETVQGHLQGHLDTLQKAWDGPGELRPASNERPEAVTEATSGLSVDGGETEKLSPDASASTDLIASPDVAALEETSAAPQETDTSPAPETPAPEAPVLETKEAPAETAAEAPAETAAEAPAAETPAAETSAAETPAAETPAAETPAAEKSAEAPATEVPSETIEVDVETQPKSGLSVDGGVAQEKKLDAAASESADLVASPDVTEETAT